MTIAEKNIHQISPMGQAINEILDGEHPNIPLSAVVKKIEDKRQKDIDDKKPKGLGEVLKDLNLRV